MLDSATATLQKIWGYSEFRGLQKPALDALFQGENGLLVMPTGSGKSLCYQLPSLHFDGVTLVVSPLIALMKDQVADLRSRKIEAWELNSALSKKDKDRALERLKRGGQMILFVTPERFRKPEFLEAVLSVKISLLAVDEAHCISQWGQDFRPDYSRLKEIREMLGKPLTLALTATATPKVREDIRRGLVDDKESWNEFVDSIERPNLFLQVYDVFGLDEKIRALIALRHQQSGPVIIYVSLISTLYKIKEQLAKLGQDSLMYHGDMNREQRHQMQQRFMDSDSDWIIATPAFGLGVNKLNIRQVIHTEIPGSVEAYYQEVGRAGRDGLPAVCTLLYDADDLPTQMEFMKWANPEPSYVRALFQELQSRLLQVQQQGLDVLRERLNFKNSRDFRVETAMNMLERFEVIDWPGHDTRQLSIKSGIENLDLSEEFYKKRMNGMLTKLQQVVDWVKLQDCRTQYIYKYFGIDDALPCGHCDLCEARTS